MNKKEYSISKIESWFTNLPEERKRQIFDDCFEFPNDLDYFENEKADN